MGQLGPIRLSQRQVVGRMQRERERFNGQLSQGWLGEPITGKARACAKSAFREGVNGNFLSGLESLLGSMRTNTIGRARPGRPESVTRKTVRLCMSHARQTANQQGLPPSPSFCPIRWPAIALRPDHSLPSVLEI